MTFKKKKHDLTSYKTVIKELGNKSKILPKLVKFNLCKELQ